MAYVVDTHAIFGDLKESGMPDQQAEAVVKAIGRSAEEMVTKDFLKAELRALELRAYGVSIALVIGLGTFLKLT